MLNVQQALLQGSSSLEQGLSQSPKLSAGMKSREPRRKVLIKARMRLHGKWTDVCIRDISSQGLLIHAPSAPSRSTYVEIYRGRHVIVARVVWAMDQRFGLQTQDRLNVQAIIGEPGLSGEAMTVPGVERRAAPRPASGSHIRWRAERSRHLSKAAEFACLSALGLSAAFLIFDGSGGIFSSSMAAVSSALLPE